MTRRYSLVIEGEEGRYSAYVPELPTIVVAAESIAELTRLASEAIQIYWEEMRIDRSGTSILREIEVDLPA